MDDAVEESGSAPVGSSQRVYDPVYRHHIVIVQPATEGVGQQLLRNRSVEILRVMGDENLLELFDVLETLAREQLARGIDRLASFPVAPHAKGIEVIER